VLGVGRDGKSVKLGSENAGVACFASDLDDLMASARQCLLNQFADRSVRANQNNLHKSSSLVSVSGVIYSRQFRGASRNCREHREVLQLTHAAIGDEIDTRL
jgi:hypothetical protein